MSRSYLRNKYMRKIYKGASFWASRRDRPVLNPHRQDEMPKNFPSKFIQKHCDRGKVAWLQESTSFGGHSIPKGGHRRVSGIVRASLKEETRKEIQEQMKEDAI